MTSKPNLTKILPYVYKLTNRISGEFYYGVRWANKVPSYADLGIVYFSSSKTIKPKFNEFITEILAEFFNKNDAILFEQQLIKDSWNVPGRLNKAYQGKSAIVIDNTRRKHTEEHKKKQANHGAKNGMFGRTRTTLEIDKANKTKSLRSKEENIKSYSRIKSQTEIDKIKATRKPFIKVSRICDKKEMDLGNFSKWIKTL